MSIVSRYLIRSYLGMTGICLGAFVSIYLIIDFLERIGRFSRAGAPLESIIQYFLCKTPEIITQTTPMALLMGTILTVGAFSRNNEINALRCSGLSLWRISRPLLVTAAAISLALLAMEELIVPGANEKVRYINQVVIQKKDNAAYFRQNNIWFRSNDRILQAKLFDPGKQLLKGVTIWELDKGLKPVSRIDAPSATPEEGGWRLAAAEVRNFLQLNADESGSKKNLFLKLDLQPADLKVVEKSADDMGFLALWRYCNNLSEGGYDTTRYRTLLHAKISLPFSALVMAFLGIPFALKDSRSSGAGVGIGISIGIGLTCFITNAFLLSLGQAGALPPLVAAWATNLIFAATGLWFTLKIDS